jgi:RP/EB family microtubule-associated protein
VAVLPGAKRHRLLERLHDPNAFEFYRQELIQWLNSLLQLNITKVEQCGTGYVLYPSITPLFRNEGAMADVLTLLYRSAALCQVFDSIYMDIPMSKVKFNVNSEYAYIQNFKVLQSTDVPTPTTVLTR